MVGDPAKRPQLTWHAAGTTVGLGGAGSDLIVGSPGGRPGDIEPGTIDVGLTMSPAAGSEDDHAGAVDTDKHIRIIGLFR